MAIVLLVLVVNLWSRYNLYRLDILTFYIPWYEHLGERLRDFDIPGWMPYAMSGSPFAGDPQSGWGYLPAMVIFTLIPGLNGYIAFLVFHVLLAAAGTYLYARVIGISPIGAFTAGITFTLGNFMERSACCTIHMQVAVWIPAIFLFYEMHRRTKSIGQQIGWLVLAAICTGQMLAGWVGQGAYYGGLAVGIYVLYRTFGGRAEFSGYRERIQSLVLVGLMLAVVGGATAGPAVLPRLDTVSRSNLQDLYQDEETASSETGWDLEQVPYRIYSWGTGSDRWYLGAVSLAAAIMAAFVCWRRRHALFFALYGLGVLLMVIRGSPLIDLFNLLPRFADLHVHSPDRIYVVLYLSPAILAGWLVDTMRDSTWSLRTRPSGVIAGSAMAVALIVLSAIWVQRDRGYELNRDQIVHSVIILLAVLGAAAFTLPRVRQVAVVVVIVMLFWDPAGILMRDRIEDDERRETLTALVDGTLNPNGAALWLQANANDGDLFRFFGYDQVQLMNQGELRTYHVSHDEPETWRILVNNRGIEFNLQDIQGYNPVQISRYVELLDWINGTPQSYHASNVLASGIGSPLLDQLNVRYIVVPAEIPPGRPDLLRMSQRYATVYVDNDTRILEKVDTMDRAWIVHDVDEEESGEDILTKFSLRLADPSRTVLLVGDEPKLERVGPGSDESVVITSYAADEIHITVNAAGTGMVVLSEIYDPGWRATVDGQSAEIYPANYVLRGVIVPEGTHEIVLTYPATLVKRSLLLYLVPLLALVVVGVRLRSERLAKTTR